VRSSSAAKSVHWLALCIEVALRVAGPLLRLRGLPRSHVLQEVVKPRLWLLVILLLQILHHTIGQRLGVKK